MIVRTHLIAADLLYLVIYIPLRQPNGAETAVRHMRQEEDTKVRKVARRNNEFVSGCSLKFFMSALRIQHLY